MSETELKGRDDLLTPGSFAAGSGASSNRNRRELLLTGVSRAAAALLSGPWETTFPRVAAILGESTGVSRVYLFVRRDDPPGTRVLDQRFEWVAPGIQPEIDNPAMQGFDPPALGFPEVEDSFLGGRPFVGTAASEANPALKEVLESQKIQSILALPVFVRHRWWGFVGFDDCVQPREWTEGETEVLRTAALLLGTAVERDLNLGDLRRSESRLAAAVNEVHDGFLVARPDGGVVEGNPAARRILRLSRRDPFPPLQGIFPSLGQNGEQGFRPLKGHGLTGHRADGTRFKADLTATPLELEREPALALVMRDVTDREALEERLRRTQQLDQVGRLAGGVAHEFNNLLTTILGYAELALDHTEEEDRQESGSPLQEIIQAARRGGQLASRLLVFSRQQVLRPTPIHLNELVEEVMALMRSPVHPELELETDLTPSLPKVRGDPSRVRQTILELCLNARDAMPGGGSLTVRTAVMELRAADIEEGEELAPGPYVVLTVEDTGKGIPDTLRKRIFEPFFTTKELDPGRGLGLSTVYGVVKQCDGEIRVASVEGGGTTFRVFLPVLPGEPSAGGEGDGS